jgi:hypothetical protein
MMQTPISPALQSGNRLIGEGSQASQIVFASPIGAACNMNGAGGFTGGGWSSLGLMLENGLGDSSAYAILLMGDATFQPDQTQWSDLYISAIGSSYWYTGFQAYGNARTAPQGIRVGSIHAVEVFKCRNVGGYFSNIVQWDIENLGFYVGKDGGNDCYITGGGTQPTNSTQVDARLLTASNIIVPAQCAMNITVNGARLA